MSELKCWKKIKAPVIDPRWSVEYENNENRHKVTVLQLRNGVFAVRSSKNYAIVLDEEFEKKPEAISFANKYMKDHDTCVDAVLGSIEAEGKRVARLRKKYRDRKFTPDELISCD